MEWKIAAKLFSQRLASSLTYKFASEKLYGFSEAVAERLRQFSEQDDNQARLIQEVIFKLEDESNGEACEDVGVQPFCVSGRSLKHGKKKRKDEDTDPFEIFKNFFRSLPRMEKEIQKTLEIALDDPSLPNKAAPIVDIEGLLDISRMRCVTLDMIKTRVEGGSLYDRPAPVYWSCYACGATTADRQKQAPDECQICGAAQSALRAGKWMIY